VTVRASLVGVVALAALTLVAAAGRAAPLAGPSVYLTAVSPAAAGEPVGFTATTGENLVARGGHYAIDLRGIDLTRKPAPTYGNPSYVAKRCNGYPCMWKVVANKATTYEFTAFLLDTTTNKYVAQSPPVQAVWLPASLPRDFELLLNGKSFPTTPITSGADDYLPIKAGKLRVEARWTNDPRASGYRIVISTTEPQARDFAVCSRGTSCVVGRRVPIDVDEEMSWAVKLVTVKGNEVVTGIRVCLRGNS
jgi:hypothetical protein